MGHDYACAVRRLILLLVLAAALAGCGGHKTSVPATSTATAAATPGPGRVLYRGGDWAVVVQADHAVAQHLAGGHWRDDTTGAVRVAVLGPKSPAAATPQVAAELRAAKPLVESALWVDGEELLAKGGGLSPTRGTIYGAPAAPLDPGKHVAVAYARTAAHATAVAWTFVVG